MQDLREEVSEERALHYSPAVAHWREALFMPAMQVCLQPEEQPHCSRQTSPPKEPLGDSGQAGA